MTRRTLSSVLAVGLLVALFAVAAYVPVPYVAMSPGPTVDVLGQRQGEEIVQVDGHKVYPAKGELELTTVAVTSPGQDLGLAEAVSAWVDGTRAIYPRDAIYAPNRTPQEEETESSVAMVQSQDTAIAAALTELGYDVKLGVEVFNVAKGSPAEGKLRPRDRIISINGTKVDDVHSVVDAVQEAGVGGTAKFVVRRSGERKTVTVTPQASEDDPDKAIVGVTVGRGYTFPFDVSVDIRDSIGGPSAGLIFSLAVYDTLTPGSLTQGLDVAGTGTISAAGKVGPIGGIQQKIVAAERSDADVFLVPPGNCESAMDAPVDEDEIRLVKAPTMHSALESIRAIAEDRDAKVPQCQ